MSPEIAADKNRCRTPSGARSSAKSDLCFYHRRFKNRARNCKSPCNFNRAKGKKLAVQSSQAHLDHGPVVNRIFVTDKSSGRDFLIDTGADISVIPPTTREKGYSSCPFQLFAANGSRIRTYGSKSVTLNLGLKRPIRWIFVIADVQSPIIGSYLLRHFDLLIDVKNGKLKDKLTNIAIRGKTLRTNWRYRLKALKKGQPTTK